LAAERKAMTTFDDSYNALRKADKKLTAIAAETGQPAAASEVEQPSLARVVQRFLDKEWCGVLNECQRKQIAKDIEFHWELAKLSTSAAEPWRTERARRSESSAADDHDIHEQPTINEIVNAYVEPEPAASEPWCAPCQSYHPYPRTIEHWHELQCKADRRDFEVQAGQPAAANAHAQNPQAFCLACNEHPCKLLSAANASPAQVCAQCESNARWNEAGGYHAAAFKCREYCRAGHRPYHSAPAPTEAAARRAAWDAAIEIVIEARFSGGSDLRDIINQLKAARDQG